MKKLDGSRAKNETINFKDPKFLMIKEFNNYVKNDNYFEISLISIGDGFDVMQKEKFEIVSFYKLLILPVEVIEFRLKNI